MCQLVLCVIIVENLENSKELVKPMSCLNRKGGLSVEYPE